MIEVSVGGSDAKLIPLKRLKQIVNLSQTVLYVSYFISDQKKEKEDRTFAMAGRMTNSLIRQVYVKMNH